MTDKAKQIHLLSGKSMYFEPGGIYHIYNQGNNRQPIFFNRGNYLYFIRKMRHHILPYADILAYCLMPNHFHLMVEAGDPSERGSDSRSATFSRTPTNDAEDHATAKSSQLLNHSIGIMLASYTRAINLQNNTTGSLFRQKTKAICLNLIL